MNSITETFREHRHLAYSEGPARIAWCLITTNGYQMLCRIYRNELFCIKRLGSTGLSARRCLRRCKTTTGLSISIGIVERRLDSLDFFILVRWRCVTFTSGAIASSKRSLYLMKNSFCKQTMSYFLTHLKSLVSEPDSSREYVLLRDLIRTYRPAKLVIQFTEFASIIEACATPDALAFCVSELTCNLNIYPVCWESIIDFAAGSLKTTSIRKHFFISLFYALLGKYGVAQRRGIPIATTMLADLATLLKPCDRLEMVSLFGEFQLLGDVRDLWCLFDVPDMQPYPTVLSFDCLQNPLRQEWRSRIPRIAVPLAETFDDDSEWRRLPAQRNVHTPMSFVARAPLPPRLQVPTAPVARPPEPIDVDAELVAANLPVSARPAPRARPRPAPRTRARPKTDALLANSSATDAEASGGEPTCCLCLENQPRVALVPCGHQCVCIRCTRALEDRVCPICRDRIQTAIVVFK